MRTLRYLAVAQPPATPLIKIKLIDYQTVTNYFYLWPKYIWWLYT